MPLYLRDEKKVLFVHIPKCAGTSIESQLGDLASTQLLFGTQDSSDLPCSAQHFHFTILNSLIPDIDSIPTLAIVRHPLLRLISEHLYRNKLRARKKQALRSFSKDIKQFFFEYQFNNMVFDNHIRPQVEFLTPSTKIFRLESGLSPALNYACASLEIDQPGFSENHEPRKNASEYKDIAISTRDVERVEKFYKLDYEALGYKTLSLGSHTLLTYRDIARELEQPFTTEHLPDIPRGDAMSHRKSQRFRRRTIDRTTSIARYLTKVAFRSSDALFSK